MADVVGLRGQPISVNEPIGELIESIEKYLAQARDGHLRGAAFVFVNDNEVITTGWSGEADKRLLLSGAALLNYRLAKSLDEQ